VDRLSARLEERDDPVRAALPGTIQHWNLNLNPPHTRNSGYLLGLIDGLKKNAQQLAGKAETPDELVQLAERFPHDLDIALQTLNFSSG
ncbi:hypothetical protein QZN00_30195, partial [Burkholderia multivorans]|nr:hypothetical protein [Burkholderia multivorans]